MFDPTIYENLKVVVEGEIYEHDLAGEITITDRQDLVDLATMSRSYFVCFKLNNELNSYEAAIKLKAEPKDLYGEILENSDEKYGCHLTLFLKGPIKNTDDIPQKIQTELEKRWDYRPNIKQEIHFVWNEEKKRNYFLNVSICFDRKINEDHISDFPEIITLLKDSLHALQQLN